MNSSLDDLVGGSDFEHPPDEGHERLFLDEGEHGAHHEQLGEGRLGVQLLHAERVEVRPHEPAAQRLSEASLESGRVTLSMVYTGQAKCMGQYTRILGTI